MNIIYIERSVLSCIVLHCIALYCIVLYCIVLYCIVILTSQTDAALPSWSHFLVTSCCEDEDKDRQTYTNQLQYTNGINHKTHPLKMTIISNTLWSYLALLINVTDLTFLFQAFIHTLACLHLILFVHVRVTIRQFISATFGNRWTQAGIARWE